MPKQTTMTKEGVSPSPSSTVPPKKKMKTSGSSDGVAPKPASFNLKTLREREKGPINPFNNVDFSTKYYTVKASRDRLPCRSPASVAELLTGLPHRQFSLVNGETGSGKTTQIPQLLLHSLQVRQGSGRIIITHPRRVAALASARRMAEELDVDLGQEVALVMRDNVRRKDGLPCQIVNVTEGILMNEIQNENPLCEGYDFVIVDEAHERSVTTDFIISHLRTLLSSGQCPKLKVIIMSATSNIPLFQDFFHSFGPNFGHPKTEKLTFELPGLEAYTRTIHHEANAVGDVKQWVLYNVRSIVADSTKSGHILVFLDGQETISDLRSAIISSLPTMLSHNRQSRDQKLKDRQVIVQSFYRDQDKYEQYEVFQDEKANTMKVILATNIAETSITIPNCEVVLDTGYTKERSYDAAQGGNRLLRAWVSRAAADQRAGRVGRVRDGIVKRAYTLQAYDKMEVFIEPAIMRDDHTDHLLTRLRLTATARRIGESIKDNALIQLPTEPTMYQTVRAAHTLSLLGLIEYETPSHSHNETKGYIHLEKVAGQIETLGCGVMMGKALLHAATNGECVAQMIAIASFISTSTKPFKHPYSNAHLKFQKRIIDPRGDFYTFINVLNMFDNEHKKWPAGSLFTLRNEWMTWAQLYDINLDGVTAAWHARDRITRTMKKMNIADHSSADPLNENYYEQIGQSIAVGFHPHIAVLDDNVLSRNEEGIKYKRVDGTSTDPLYLDRKHNLGHVPKYLIFNELWIHPFHETGYLMRNVNVFEPDHMKLIGQYKDRRYYDI